MSKYSENLPPSLKGAVEWMYDYIQPGSVLLDFGCSTGYFGEFIKKSKRCTVFGVEISDDFKKAEKVLDGVYSFDLDGEWPAKVYEHTYDYLFFGDVLEHLKDPGSVLQKCQRLLKSEGKIFISTPNIAHISTRLELMTGNFDYESMGILDETHLKYFTKVSLERLVNSSGYKIDHFDFSSNDFPKEIITSLLKKIGLVGEKKFWDMTKTLEARAYQFKLVISKNINNKKSENYILPEKPYQYRDNILLDYNKEILALKRHADEQAKIIQHINNEKSELRNQISILNLQLNSTLSVRMRKIAHRAKTKVAKKVK